MTAAIIATITLPAMAQEKTAETTADVSARIISLETLHVTCAANDWIYDFCQSQAVRDAVPQGDVDIMVFKVANDDGK